MKIASGGWAYLYAGAGFLSGVTNGESLSDCFKFKWSLELTQAPTLNQLLN